MSKATERERAAATDATSKATSVGRAIQTSPETKKKRKISQESKIVMNTHRRKEREKFPYYHHPFFVIDPLSY